MCNFFITQLLPEAGKGSVKAPGVAVEEAIVPECAAMKTSLLQRIAKLRLPPNFLDEVSLLRLCLTLISPWLHQYSFIEKPYTVCLQSCLLETENACMSS